MLTIHIPIYFNLSFLMWHLAYKLQAKLQLLCCMNAFFCLFVFIICISTESSDSHCRIESNLISAIFSSALMMAWAGSLLSSCSPKQVHDGQWWRSSGQSNVLLERTATEADRTECCLYLQRSVIERKEVWTVISYSVLWVGFTAVRIVFCNLTWGRITQKDRTVWFFWP